MAVAFTDGANEDLEKQYCLPQNEGCTVTIKDEVLVLLFISFFFYFFYLMFITTMTNNVRLNKYYIFMYLLGTPVVSNL